MDKANQVINGLLHLIIQIGHLLMSAVIGLELSIRDELAQAGLPPPVQTVLMLAIAALLILGALRLFGGLIRIAVVLLLVLVAIHIILPVLPA